MPTLRTVEKIVQFLDEISDLPAPHRDAARPLDDLDRQLYGQAIHCLQNDAAIDAIIRELRRTAKFRPTPEEVETLAKRIAGVVPTNPELTQAEIEARRVYRIDRDRLLPGSGEVPNRERARQVLASLRKRAGIPDTTTTDDKDRRPMPVDADTKRQVEAELAKIREKAFPTPQAQAAEKAEAA